MERVRTESPLYSRQKSISSASAASLSSPVMSPMHRHVRSGSTGVTNFRRTQNYAAKAAAQRLARVMAHQPAEDDDDDEDDKMFDYSATPSSRRAARSPSPALGRYLAEQTPAVRSTSAGRPSIVVKPTALIPPIKPLSRPVIATLASEPPVDDRRQKRMSVDLGNLNIRETGHPHSSFALHDEIDALHEENENILEKLRLAEERCDNAEARARQLEKQVASLGEGVSLEARLFSRKEATLQRREAALKAAAQNSDAKSEEIAALRLEVETARDEASSAVEHLQEAKDEIESLRTMTQGMLLTQEEMEEVVLKRCWLARYWKLCVQHGVHAEIAETKYEYWSSLAPLPLDVVLAVGRKARDDFSSDIADVEVKEEVPLDSNDLSGEENIQSMLLVEKGLRELASLKVEDAILLAMAQHRRPNIKPSQSFSGSLLPSDGQSLAEAFELSQEEIEDVLFKQAWLTYFWRRVKNHGLEEDIADERLQFWIIQSTHSPTSQDAVDVERGLLELKKLGIESRLWEASRKGTDQDSTNPSNSD